MRKVADRTPLDGKRFFNWTVLSRKKDRSYKNYRITFWLCRCDCGFEKIISRPNLITNECKCDSCYHNLKQKILDKVTKKDSGCWEFSGSTRSGYGRMRYMGKTISLHREAYKQFKGEIPEGLSVLHHCDNRCCCNPDHLYLGTQADNIKDIFARNRQKSPIGMRNGNAKLTDIRAKMAKFLCSKGYPYKEIGSLFDVNEETIGSVARGHRWKHI